MAGLLEYTKNGQVTEPPLYRFMKGNVQSFLNSIPDPSGLTKEEQLNLAANVNPMMGLIGALAPARYIGKTLEGMPNVVDIGGKLEQFGTDQRLVDIAGDYAANRGLLYNPLENIVANLPS